MTVTDPYKVLQVDPEAEDEVIEAAYRRLARKYHPDVAPGAEAQERMVRINQAWEMLKDPMRRAAVDRARLRGSDAAARVAAADAHARAASHLPTVPREPAVPRPAGGDGPHVPPSWGFPRMSDSGDAGFGQRPQYVSPDWTTGRSNDGGRYDPGTMRTPHGEGSAGAPPGNPSGSVLNFGRYAGWSLGEIGRTDLEYLEWLDRTPIGRIYQAEIDTILRAAGRRTSAPRAADPPRGLFRRR